MPMSRQKNEETKGSKRGVPAHLSGELADTTPSSS